MCGARKTDCVKSISDLRDIPYAAAVNPFPFTHHPTLTKPDISSFCSFHPYADCVVKEGAACALLRRLRVVYRTPPPPLFLSLRSLFHTF
jgi:hypothetical protein